MTAAAVRIHEIRARERISQAELARRSGVAQSTISRIESGDLDPTWSTMHSLLHGAGWTGSVERTDLAGLLPPTEVWKRMRSALKRGAESEAIRDLSEMTGRILRYGNSTELPDWATREPDSTGSMEWDTIAATAFAFAVDRAGGEAPAWALAVPRLSEETVVGMPHAPAEYRDFLRPQTPKMFRDKNLLSRERDWATA